MDGVIIERIGALARLRLNRPAAINALTHAMVHQIDTALDQWQADPLVAAIVLTGEGSRGLCAGGDIRSLYDAPRDAAGASMAFWRDEYRLDARIARSATPVIAVMDGLVMGGGIGISAHAAQRIVTERSKIALPECTIGFFPDVGATWLLPRAPGQLGTWMGMTGRSLGAADAILTGFADHFVPSDRLEALISALGTVGKNDVSSLIARFADDPGPAPLARHRALIDWAFAGDSVAAIMARLAAEPDDFAAQTLSDLRAKSPTSLAFALRLVRLGANVPTLEAALELEYAACRHFVRGPDFYEGIRAAIIDKDRNPKWHPDSLDGVDASAVERALELTTDRVFAPKEA